MGNSLLLAQEVQSLNHSLAQSFNPVTPVSAQVESLEVGLDGLRTLAGKDLLDRCAQRILGDADERRSSTKDDHVRAANRARLLG